MRIDALVAPQVVQEPSVGLSTFGYEPRCRNNLMSLVEQSRQGESIISQVFFLGFGSANSVEAEEIESGLALGWKREYRRGTGKLKKCWNEG